MSDSTVERAMLFDFYGELLTEKQREYYDLHYNEDFSLSEIAEREGISRQGVWDIVRRAEGTLRATEEKTGLLKRFEERREKLAEIRQYLEALRGRMSGAERELLQKALLELDNLEM